MKKHPPTFWRKLNGARQKPNDWLHCGDQNKRDECDRRKVQQYSTRVETLSHSKKQVSHKYLSISRQIAEVNF
jgi:hypothetical protein